MVHIPFWLTEQHEESVIERVQEVVFLRRQRIDSVAPNLPRDIPPQHCFAFSELAPGKDTATTNGGLSNFYVVAHVSSFGQDNAPAHLRRVIRSARGETRLTTRQARMQRGPAIDTQATPVRDG